MESYIAIIMPKTNICEMARLKTEIKIKITVKFVGAIHESPDIHGPRAIRESPLRLSLDLNLHPLSIPIFMACSFFLHKHFSSIALFSSICKYFKNSERVHKVNTHP
jgi:hypothetical protein